MVYLKITKSNGKIIRCELRKNPSRQGRPIPYQKALKLIEGQKPTTEITFFDFYSATYDLSRKGGEKIEKTA
jgi:hypothetical protein